MDSSKDRRVLELLDSYLDEYGAGCKDMVLGAPDADYLATLEQLEPQHPETAADSAICSRTQSLLDAFIAGAEQPRMQALGAERPLQGECDVTDDPMQEPVLQDTYYTETLARIFLKQHRYEKALEIIKSLYLNFPNKSIYFADQIRYLEKLIRINQKNRIEYV